MERFEYQFTAMGGLCRLRIDCDNEAIALAAQQLGKAEVRRLENKYSRYLPESVTSKINALAGTGQVLPIDSETAGLLNYAQTLWRESGGLFDLTSGVLRRAWNFKSSVLPRQEQLDALITMIDWERVTWDEQSVYLPEEAMELDFGGCVKEYACDSVAAIIQRVGVTHALVDLSGDMAAVGGQGSGEPWQIGIRDPQEKDSAIAQLSLASGGLASSGDYERCMVIEGKRYGHILNPKTGWPVSDGLVAVSVVADQCLVAGSSATIAMLMPAEQALAWLGRLGLSWLAVDAQFNTHGTVAADNAQH